MYENGLRTMVVVDQNADGVMDLPGVGDPPSDAADQVTRWVYGVSKGSVAGGQSEIASNNLLRAVVYPDSSNNATTGAAIDSDSGDVASFSYNAQGQVVRRRDQAGNVITTTYDDAGRATASAVATLAGGFDGAVRRVEHAYNNRGLLSTVTQYDASSAGTVTDQVAYTFDGWGNLTNLSQDHNSAVDGNAFHVAFAYAKAAPSGGRHTIRRSSMTFPSGYAAQYVVLNSTIESNLSRVGQVKLGHANNFVTVATYDYLGTSGVVGTTLPEPEVYSNRFDSGGDYVRLDRWNRPTTWTWTDRASPWPKTILDARSGPGGRWQMR